MRVTLEKGETLAVALVENDRIVGTINLSLRGDVGRPSASAVSRVALSSAMSGAGSISSPESTAGKRGRRRGKRNISPEARRRMAEAQKRRWAKYRSGK